MYALEKGMAAHCSVLAWRIPGTGEPGGLPAMGSHRVGHDRSDLTAAAAAHGQLCLTRCDPVGCSPPGSSVHGILQARTLQWCHSLLQGSSWPRNQTWVFCIADRFFAIWATRGALTAAILRALKRKEHQITRGPNTECRFWPKDTGSGSRFRAGWFEWLWWTQGKGLSRGQLSLRMAGGGDRGPGCEREDPRLRAWPQGHWFAYEWLSLGINSLKKGTPSRVSKAPGVKASENTEKIRLFKNTSSATRLILFCHKF